MIVNWFDMIGAMQVREEAPARRRGICCELEVPADEWTVPRAALLKALADPTRLSMVAALRQASAPVCICDFTAAYELSQPTISHHMAKLRAAGLVAATRRGIWVYYRLRTDLPGDVEQVLDAVLGRA